MLSILSIIAVQMKDLYPSCYCMEKWDTKLTTRMKIIENTDSRNWLQGCSVLVVCVIFI